MTRFGMVLASGVCMAVTTLAGDWPQFRGPGHDGISGESDWFVPKAVVKTVWTAEVGVGHAAISVSAGRLYTMGNRQGTDVVFCLEAATGKAIWQHSYASASGNYPGPRSTPTVDGRRVFTFGRDGMLLCLDAAKGGVMWQRDLGKDMNATPPQWGFASSPLVVGERVIVNVGTHGLAVNRLTGKTVWESGGAGGSYASPVPYQWKGQPAVLVLATAGISAVDAGTGQVGWFHPWKTGCDVNAADPLPIQDKVLITSGYGHGAALLDVTGDQPKVEWENKHLVSHFSSPVLSGSHVYGVHGDAGEGELRCLDLATGAVKWGNPDIGFGSLIMAGGKLLFLSEKGLLVVMVDDPEACRELWRGKILDSTCWTMPVVCNGLIYCRNDKGHLICLDLRGK